MLQGFSDAVRSLLSKTLSQVPGCWYSSPVLVPALSTITPFPIPTIPLDPLFTTLLWPAEACFTCSVLQTTVHKCAMPAAKYQQLAEGGPAHPHAYRCWGCSTSQAGTIHQTIQTDPNIWAGKHCTNNFGKALSSSASLLFADEQVLFILCIRFLTPDTIACIRPLVSSHRKPHSRYFLLCVVLLKSMSSWNRSQWVWPDLLIGQDDLGSMTKRQSFRIFSPSRSTASYFKFSCSTENTVIIPLWRGL